MTTIINNPYIQQRILKNIIVDEETGCWEWQNYCNKFNGYGQFWIGRDSNKKSIWNNTHRVSYQAFRGSIPEGLEIAHKCHNRKCCCPDHLEATTHYENIMMSVNDGRFRKGEQKNNAKLTDSIVQILREGKVFADMTVASIARIFDVDNSTIRDAINGKTWKHVAV